MAYVARNSGISEIGGATGGAIGGQNGRTEANLLMVIEAWPNLSNPAKERIQEIVEGDLGSPKSTVDVDTTG